MATLTRKKEILSLIAVTTVALCVTVSVYHQLHTKGDFIENELSDELWVGGDPYIISLASRAPSNQLCQQGRLGNYYSNFIRHRLA